MTTEAVAKTPTGHQDGGRRGLIPRLWGHIARRRRRQFGLLLILMFVASLAELFSIGAVLPFIAILTAPEQVFGHALLQPAIRMLDIQEPQGLLIPITLVFCLAALFAAAVRFSLMWVGTRLSYATGADISLEVYRRTLYQPYSVHISRNSSEIVAAVSSKTQAVVSGAIYPMVQMLAAGSTLVIVTAALIAYQPVIALVTIATFGALYLTITRLTRARLIANSRNVSIHASRRVKALNEGLGGIRDLLLDGTQPTYCAIFQDADRHLRKAQAQNTVISSSPRFLMEAMGMVLIALLALWLSMRPGGFGGAIPLLGALAVSAQKLLPMLQQLYQNWTNFKGNNRSILDVLDLLDQPLPLHLSHASGPPLSFAREIRLDGVGFRYRQDAPWVLDGINLTVPKGSRVGIVGTTGSGKSTLIDIVMGLLMPERGRMLVDDVEISPANQLAWQAHIAHVPQAIFLADASIAENIAFGVPVGQIDRARVEQVATQAQLAQTIDALPAGYNTRVGERGVQLSGGQRQRIGIARALYKAADVIVLDEATSALDSATEEAVMAAIDALDRELTVFIVAHRVTTLKNCDFTIEVIDGRAVLKTRCSTH